jgi:hypothetical protein
MSGAPHALAARVRSTLEPPQTATLPPRSLPAVVITDELWVAARDIEAEEEVTYDYAVSETTASTHMPFDCRCGAAACRGRITGEDCLKSDVRAKYAGHFTSLVVDFQKEHDDRVAAGAAAAGAGGGAAAAPAAAGGAGGGGSA